MTTSRSGPGLVARLVGRACQATVLVWGGLAALVLAFGLDAVAEVDVLWVLGLVLVLAGLAFLAVRVGGRSVKDGGWATVSAGSILLLVAALVVAVVFTLSQPVARKARLAADQGTVGALRAAAAIYYGKNRTWPTQATLQTLVQPSPPVFQCTGATWSADTTNGKITYSPNDLSALGGC